MSWRGLGKIDKLRGLPGFGGAARREEDLGGVALTRALPGDIDEEFQAAIPEIGEEYARIAQRMRREGNSGTIPELLAQDWLYRRKIPFVAQVEIPQAHARVDIIVREEIAIRVQGEYFHSASSPHDKSQKYALKLLGFRPVDVWETVIYRARDYAMGAAIRGREVGRGYGGTGGVGQRGAVRRQ